MNDGAEIIVRKLPLWRSASEEMLNAGIAYGQTFTAEYFEKCLSCQADSLEFSIGISKIRRELEKHGFYLSGQGGKGRYWTVVHPNENADQMLRYSADAMDALKRGVILGTNTRLDTLSAADRARHEAILERIATKAVLLQRSKGVVKALGANANKLLK